jgi:hypothetical protein
MPEKGHPSLNSMNVAPTIPTRRHKPFDDSHHARTRRIKLPWPLAVAAVSFLWIALLHVGAMAEDDVLQLAINYIFTGKIDPPDRPEIVDRNSCIVVVFEPKFQAYVRYYLSRFRLDSARISKTYSGQQILHILEVQGDEIVVEHLDPNKTTVARGFKSAQIALPGDIDQSEKALRIIADRCKAEKPKSPFLLLHDDNALAGGPVQFQQPCSLGLQP